MENPDAHGRGLLDKRPVRGFTNPATMLAAGLIAFLGIVFGAHPNTSLHVIATQPAAAAVTLPPAAQVSATVAPVKEKTAIVSAPTQVAAAAIAPAEPQRIIVAEASGVSEAELTQKLQDLANSLRSSFPQTPGAPVGTIASGGMWNSIAGSNKIDQLDGTTLNGVHVNGVTGLTASDLPDLSGSYLPLTGGTLSSLSTSGHVAIGNIGGIDSSVDWYGTPYKATQHLNSALNIDDQQTGDFGIGDGASTLSVSGSYVHTGPGGSIFGVAANALVATSSTGALDYFAGSGGYANNFGTGRIDQEVGVDGASYNYGAGLVNDMYAFNSEGVNNYGSGTVNNGYGIFLMSPTVTTGKLGNVYGVYVADQSGVATSSSYNIYSAGSGKNYFGGAVGIGTTSPSALLAVAGNAYMTGGLGVGAINATAGSIVATATSTALNFLASDNGAVGAPAYTFANAKNSGMYAAGSNNLKFAANGVNSLTVTDSQVYVPLSGTAVGPAISFGAANLGFFSPAANVMGFSTGGVERMRLDSAGNLGIGTTSPSAGLAVNASSVGIYATSTTFGGNGGGLQSWQSTTGLPSAAYLSESVTANGYIYEIGGYFGGVLSSVYYAKVNPDGSVGSWQTNANTLPAPRYMATAVTVNGYVYLLGGSGGGGSRVSTVYYAKLNADGSTGAWQTAANALPDSFFGSSSVVANGYIYEIGGFNGSYTSAVYYAKVNADGSVGVWQTANALPATRERSATVTANGYVYAIGGYSSGNQSTVYYATLNPDGSIGAWQTAGNALPGARGEATAFVASGYVYIIGGYDGSGNTQSTVYFAKLNSDGTVGQWQTASNPLTAARASATSVALNGYVYELGGMDSSPAVQSTVYYASIARTVFSTALDLISSGSSITAGDIFSNGALNVLGTTQLSGGLGVNGSFTLNATTSQAQNVPIFSINNATGTAPILTAFYNGSVGIGTTTPGARFSITGAGTGSAYTFQAADANNNALLSIQDNGSVGVGTTTLSALFTVAGGATAASTVFSSASTGVSYTVPAGVTQLVVKTWGGGGGGAGSQDGSDSGGAGGGGGFAQATITVTPGETLTIKVGGGGGAGGHSSGSGGTNGGGSGGLVEGALVGGSGGGGGYSEVLRGSTPLVQAGGGGGGGYAGEFSGNGGGGGAGGGNSGVAGGSTFSGNGGGAGTQSTGGTGGPNTTCFDSGSAGNGSANQGGTGGSNGSFCNASGGGGGGGQFGGGGGGLSNSGAGGGGGSDLVTGSNTAETAGSGVNAANSSDANYAGNAGKGGSGSTGSSGGAGTDGRVVIVTVSTTAVQFTNSSASSIATFLGSGYSGIGTTTPWGKLSVLATDNALAPQLVVASSSNVSFMVDQLGRIGINTSAPANYLSISTSTNLGTISMEWDGTSQYAGGFNDKRSGSTGDTVFNFMRNTTQVGSISETNTATTYNTTSDRRLKENIATTTAGLSVLMQIPVDDFSFISDPAHQRTQGFIAQDVEALYPEAVTTNGDNGVAPLSSTSTPWSVDYGRITPLIVRSVQDIANLSDTFKGTLIAWLGDAGNGIDDLFARNIYADKLCAKNADGSYTCVTGDQLAAAISGAGSAPAAAPQQDSGTSTTESDTSAGVPVIEINGDNPSHLQIGTTYVDLGAVITGPTQADTNLGVQTFFGTTPLEYALIDTSAPATYHIYYVATNASGTSTSTRTVIVDAPVGDATTTPDETDATTTDDTATTSPSE